MRIRNTFESLIFPIDIALGPQNLPKPSSMSAVRHLTHHVSPNASSSVLPISSWNLLQSIAARVLWLAHHVAGEPLLASLAVTRLSLLFTQLTQDYFQRKVGGGGLGQVYILTKTTRLAK